MKSSERLTVRGGACDGRLKARRVVFDMLAKSGCTMWSGCQGVKSGRFAQDDRRLVACRSASRHTRHDGDTVPGTQRSEQTLRALRALATICTRTTYCPHSPIRSQPQPMRAPSCSTKTRSIGAKRPLCRRIWNGRRHPVRSSIMAQQNPSALGGAFTCARA